MKMIQNFRVFLLLIQISVLTYGCDTAQSPSGNDHSHAQDHTYSSIEEALKDSLGAKVLFLNDVDSIPPEIGKLINVSFLTISNSAIRNLPESISNLQKLTVVNFLNCSFLDIPPQIFLVSGVGQVKITSGRISSIPVEFKVWKLYFLDMSDNNLIKFDNSSVDLSHMGYLILNDNKLTDFPFTRKMAPHLTDLWLKGNQLPDSIKARLKTEFSDINLYLDM